MPWNEKKFDKSLKKTYTESISNGGPIQGKKMIRPRPDHLFYIVKQDQEVGK